MNINEIVTSTRMRNARLLDDINNKILNREYYKFKYLPFEGALPGLYFQQQTEDAINDIGNVAYATEQVADEALKIAQQAYNIALAALETANNALAAAQTAQQTADTALNKANAAQSAADAAQTTANNALSAAANAQDTANNAVSIANTASSKADTAIEAAQNAQTSANDANARLDIVQPIVSELQWYNNITDAVNLNDYTELGRKYIQNTSSTNLPVPAEGWLDIDEDENETSIRQMFITGSSGKKYVRFGTIVPDSDPTEVSAWTAWVEYAIKTDLDSTTTALTERIDTVANNLATHKADFNNPHKVTAEQLGLTTVYQYKGSVATYADLPTTGQKVGDVWNVETADPDHGIKAGDNVAWDGAQWDILGGNHDLSGYAQLNSANTFTALNTFRANIAVSNGTTAGSQGKIILGNKPQSATVQANIISSTKGALNYIATENTGHYFRIGNNIAQTSITTNDGESAIFSHNAFEFARVTNVGVARWLGNANTATKLETARTINGVAFDGTKDITIEAGGGGGDVTAAGDNNFTGTNTFNKPITVRDGALAGIGGTITLGTKPNSATTQAKINSSATGAMYYTATEGLAHFFNVGTAEVATIGGTATTATLDFLANSILKYSTSSGLRVGGGGTSKIIGFYPEAADNTAGMNLSNQTEMIDTDYSILSLQRNSHLTYTNNAALQVGSFKFLEIDKTTQDLTLSVNGVKNGTANILFKSSGDRLAQIDYNGTLTLKEGLVVGTTANTNIANGVIRAGNSENCLYFCGTAENTYYSTPNTGNVILYQSSANCYLINCAINNPSSLTMNFEGMDFKATVGSVPYMCKTLTFWLPVGATVPAVTWTFPTGSAVYYPKGVAPTLTANANNIINVIAVVDDTGSFSIQVCDTVVLPYSGYERGLKMNKKTVYRYKGTDYTSINALRRAMPNVSLPNTLTDEQCSALNILKLELNYSTDEARAIRISQLYQEYQSELVVPTKYEVNGKTYYIDRDTDNIIKFNSAHEVAKMKGDNLFRAKNEAGEYELVTLTVGDFESILLKSALLQQSAYNRFKQARDAVNKYKRADKIFLVEF